MRLSIRARLLILTAVALIPPLGVIIYSERSLTQARETEVHEQALRSAKLASSELVRILGGLENLLLALVQGPFVQKRDEAECSSYVERLRPKVPHLKALGVADTLGRAWCGTGAGLSLADRIYFQDAMAKPDTLFVGLYTLGRVSKAEVIAFGLRLANADAVAYGSLDLKWLSEELRQRGLPQGASLTLADREGTILVRHPLSERFVGTKIPEPFMRLVTAKESGTENIISQDGTARVLGYIPATVPPRDLYLSVGLSYEATYGNIERLARLAALIAAFGACLALIAAWLVGDRMVAKPLSTIAMASNRWRHGDSKVRTGLTGASEFGVVGSNLDRMMDELAAAQHQREILTGELEHRVKNMLTTVQAIARMSFHSLAAKSELDYFLSRLRALSQGYSAVNAERWEEASLSDLVDRAIEPLGGRANERFVIDGPSVHLSSRQVLAVSMVLHELGTNALKYGALTRPQGKVTISWSVDSGGLRLVWAETGGTAVTAPTRNGFGTRLINNFGNELGHIDLLYEPEGVRCILTFSSAKAEVA